MAIGPTATRPRIPQLGKKALKLFTLIYEQSKIWAQRILKEMPDAKPLERFRRMFEEAFAREPETHEFTILMDSLPELMKIHGGNPNSLELWHDLCHGLFSMNDFIYLR